RSPHPKARRTFGCSGISDAHLPCPRRPSGSLIPDPWSPDPCPLLTGRPIHGTIDRSANSQARRPPMTAEELRRRRDPDATRAEILEAAEQLFLQDGFGRTSISAIARLAGVTKSLIHHHFGTKEAL